MTRISRRRERRARERRGAAGAAGAAALTMQLQRTSFLGDAYWPAPLMLTWSERRNITSQPCSAASCLARSSVFERAAVGADDADLGERVGGGPCRDHLHRLGRAGLAAELRRRCENRTVAAGSDEDEGGAERETGRMRELLCQELNHEKGKRA